MVTHELARIGGSGKIFGWMLNSFRKKEEKGTLDRELPFAALMFTLMAASGISLYESWKKMRGVNLLPTVQN